MAVPAASADEVADFYRGRTIGLTVGFNPGGGYDAYGRLIARHITRYIPGSPTIVVRNLQGAGSLIAANRLYNVAPRDGSELALLAGAAAVDAAIGGVPAQFDGRRFTWLGSPNSDVALCIARPDPAFRSIDDVLRNEMITGTASSGTLDWPMALNNVLGTKFKLVKGYRGNNELQIAMQRHEIEGYCNFLESIQPSVPGGLDGIKQGAVRALVQLSIKKSPELADVPFVMDYAKSEDDRAVLALVFGALYITRPVAAPPDIPPERAAALRAAFAATMKDPQFLQEAGRLGFTITPVSAAEIAQFLDAAYRTPPALIERVRHLLGRS
jgi:tripartite-type tricarboxylate transporter receptor subunit TctC